MLITVKEISDISKNEISEIKEKLSLGELIVYPTDTVYGLGAIINNETAIENIYKVKSRKFSSPLIALISSLEIIEKIAYLDEKNRNLVKKLAEKFWPGALTIILKKKEIVPNIMVSNGDTIGIRIPNLDISLKIIELAGGVLATTSANISGEPSPKSYKEVSQAIKNKVTILVDGGHCKIGEASTIIDLSTSKARLIRKGAIEIEEIKKIIGEIEV